MRSGLLDVEATDEEAADEEAASLFDCISFIRDSISLKISSFDLFISFCLLS